MAGKTDLDGARDFATTRWSVVLKAADEEEPAQMEALTSLCETYWHPLYFFARRKGQSSHEAKDLIQGFFCRLLEKNFLKSVDPRKGRFRAFLITALKHHMANEWDRQNAQKRGGGAHHVSLDFERADALYAQQEGGPVEAESLYDRTWALTLLNGVFEQLRLEYEQRDKGELFAYLRASLLKTEGTMKYEEAAEKFGVALGTVKSDAKRMRDRFGERLRAAVEETVDHERDVDDELRYLISQVGS